MEDCNKRRWFFIFKRETPLAIAERHEKLDDALKKLRAALREFRSVERVKLIKPYEKLFDPDTLKLKDENAFVSRYGSICYGYSKSGSTLIDHSLLPSFLSIPWVHLRKNWQIS